MQAFTPKLTAKYGDIEIYNMPDPTSETGYAGQVIYKNGKPLDGKYYDNSRQIQNIINQLQYNSEVQTARNADDTHRYYSFVAPDSSHKFNFDTKSEAENARNQAYGDYDALKKSFTNGGQVENGYTGLAPEKLLEFFKPGILGAYGAKGQEKYNEVLRSVNPNSSGVTSSNSSYNNPASTNSPSQTTGMSQGANDLIKKALLNNDLTNLQKNDWWSSNPSKQEAYQGLQDVLSSPDKMANFVKSNGITDLKNYSWWNDSPYKQQAWSLIQQPTQGGQPTQSNQSSVSQTNTQTQSSQPQPASNPQVAQVTPQANPQDISAALDIINKSGLDQHTKDLYTEAVKNWDSSQEINIPNILKTFTEIKKNTIDPFFKEQTNTVIDQYKRAYDSTQSERQLQLESEQSNAQQNIRGAQNNLEASGLTFSGEGIRQLGAKSAYAQDGTSQAQQSAIPTQQPFGGQYTEGLINQGNRLMSSSSQAQYQKNLTDLSRQAEQTLGTVGSQGLIPGIDKLGGIDQSASLPSSQRQAEGSALSNLYSQEQQNVQARKPLNVFST